MWIKCLISRDIRVPLAPLPSPPGDNGATAPTKSCLYVRSAGNPRCRLSFRSSERPSRAQKRAFARPRSSTQSGSRASAKSYARQSASMSAWSGLPSPSSTGGPRSAANASSRRRSATTRFGRRSHRWRSGGLASLSSTRIESSRSTEKRFCNAESLHLPIRPRRSRSLAPARSRGSPLPARSMAAPSALCRATTHGASTC